jgi:hypothetical protein
MSFFGLATIGFGTAEAALPKRHAAELSGARPWTKTGHTALSGVEAVIDGGADNAPLGTNRMIFTGFVQRRVQFWKLFTGGVFFLPHPPRIQVLGCG